MDIKDLNRQQYYQLFEIDRIKKALFVSILEHNKLIKNYHIPKSKLRRIEKLLKDFRIVCFKLIRCELDNTDDYSRYSKTLLIIISKIRTIIRSEKGIKDGFGKVYRLLPLSETKFQSFLNGYFTRLCSFAILITLLVSLIVNFAAFCKSPTIQSSVVVLALCALLLIYSLFRTIMYRKIENSATLDRIRRTIDKNIYFDKRFNLESIDIITTIIQKLFKLH